MNANSMKTQNQYNNELYRTIILILYLDLFFVSDSLKLVLNPFFFYIYLKALIQTFNTLLTIK